MEFAAIVMVTTSPAVMVPVSETEASALTLILAALTIPLSGIRGGAP